MYVQNVCFGGESRLSPESLGSAGKPGARPPFLSILAALVDASVSVRPPSPDTKASTTHASFLQEPVLQPSSTDVSFTQRSHFRTSILTIAVVSGHNPARSSLDNPHRSCACFQISSPGASPHLLSSALRRAAARPGPVERCARKRRVYLQRRSPVRFHGLSRPRPRLS